MSREAVSFTLRTTRRQKLVKTNALRKSEIALE